MTRLNFQRRAPLAIVFLLNRCTPSAEGEDNRQADTASSGSVALTSSGGAESSFPSGATTGDAAHQTESGGSGAGAEPGLVPVAATGGTSAKPPPVVGLPFLIGADITHTLEDEYWGAIYSDGGVQKPLELILRDHGFNAIRIDTFVDPAAPGGFAEGQPVAFRSLDQTIVLAQRVKAQEMFLLLDLHMSDTWTNPGAQGTPSAWVGLSLDDLERAVHEYVGETVQRLSDAGVAPDMVQIGNEITNGLLWDQGRIVSNDFSNVAALLRAGISAVRAVDPKILVMLHIEKCNDLSTSRWWLDGVLAQDVDFDVFGQSCYGATEHHAGYQGEPDEWATVFNSIAADYPNLKFAIAEYSSEQRAANDAVFNLPNERGIGTFNWDPTRFYETHPNLPLFEAAGAWNNFAAVEDQMAVYDQMAADYAAQGR